AGAIYWVRVTDDPRANVRIQGPDGPVAEPEDRFRERVEVAFRAPKAGTYTALLQPVWNERPNCQVVVREMDGKEALPAHLRLPAGPITLPGLTQSHALNVYDKQTSSAAFAPDNKSFYMAHGDGTLSYWGHPDPIQKGSFKVGMRLYGLGIDKD